MSPKPWPASCRLAALVLALGIASLALAAPQAEVYRVQHRTAEELLPYAEAALGSEGRVVVDPGTNSLVLFSERADLLRSALALLAAQDRGAAHGRARVRVAARERARCGGHARRLGRGDRRAAHRQPDRSSGRRARAGGRAGAKRARDGKSLRDGPDSRGPLGTHRHGRERADHHARPAHGDDDARSGGFRLRSPCPRARRWPRPARAASLRGPLPGRWSDRDVRRGHHAGADARQDGRDRRARRGRRRREPRRVRRRASARARSDERVLSITARVE